MTKLRVTIVFEFDVNPKLYFNSCSTPEEMAEVERDALVNNPDLISKWAKEDGYSVKVEVVE